MRLIKMVEGIPDHREWHYGYNFKVGTVRSVEDYIADKLLRTPKFTEVVESMHAQAQTQQKRGPGRPRKNQSPQSSLLPSDTE